MSELIPRTRPLGIQGHLALPVAIANRGLRGKIEFLEVPPSETAAAFFEALYELHRRHRGSLVRFLQRWLLFQEPTVGFASLSNIAIDIEGQDLSRSVSLLRHWRNNELTEALRHRQDISRMELILPLLLCILANPENHVLVLGSEISRIKVLFLSLIAMLACVAAGVLVGVLFHSVELGFACGGGAATALAAVEASVFWTYR